MGEEPNHTTARKHGPYLTEGMKQKQVYLWTGVGSSLHDFRLGRGSFLKDDERILCTHEANI